MDPPQPVPDDTSPGALAFQPKRQEDAAPRARRESVPTGETDTPLRTSSYTIYSDLPGEAGEVLLVHGYTGAYDKVSRRVAAYLRACSGKKPANGVEAPSAQTIEVLKRRGYLTTRAHQEEEEIFSRLTKAFSERAAKAQPAYVIMPTYSCNLRCPYCFQDNMRTESGLKHLLRTMQPEMVDRIFDVMPSIERRHGMNGDSELRRAFLFFGGEPLLAASRGIVEYFMEKAKSLSTTSFMAVSNATQLEAYGDLLGPEGISYLQITLDGPPAEHDLRRIHADGSGSFEKIAANITMALDRGARIKVRLNVDRNNVEQLPALAEEFVARGWDTRERFGAYAAPIHGCNDKTDSEPLMSSWELSRRITELRQEHAAMRLIAYYDETLRDRLLKLFTQQADPMPSFRPVACGAHSTSYIFDALGDVYVCWEHLANENTGCDTTSECDQPIGRISQQGELVLDEDILKLWRNRTVAANPVCRRCRYAFYCGGGCASIAERESGSLYRNFCDAFPRRFRAVAAQAYAEFVEGKTPLGLQDIGCDR